jgi:hypothetical protein
MTDPPLDGPVMKTAHQVALIFGVRPATVRMWAWRGHITSYGRMYDLREVLEWWETRRDDRMAKLREGDQDPRPPRV